MSRKCVDLWVSSRIVLFFIPCDTEITCFWGQGQTSCQHKINFKSVSEENVRADKHGACVAFLLTAKNRGSKFKQQLIGRQRGVLREYDRKCFLVCNRSLVVSAAQVNNCQDVHIHRYIIAICFWFSMEDNKCEMFLLAHSCCSILTCWSILVHQRSQVDSFVLILFLSPQPPTL